jgi:hypothetical protein
MSTITIPADALRHGIGRVDPAITSVILARHGHRGCSRIRMGGIDVGDALRWLVMRARETAGSARDPAPVPATPAARDRCRPECEFDVDGEIGASAGGSYQPSFERILRRSDEHRIEHRAASSRPLNLTQRVTVVADESRFGNTAGVSSIVRRKTSVPAAPVPTASPGYSGGCPRMSAGNGLSSVMGLARSSRGAGRFDGKVDERLRCDGTGGQQQHETRDDCRSNQGRTWTPSIALGTLRPADRIGRVMLPATAAAPAVSLRPRARRFAIGS